MEIKGWEIYNHAAIPTTAPDETPDTQPVKDGSIWKLGGASKPLLARWTTDFDCEASTNWWYMILDAPFDIASLKSDRRRKILRGTRDFDVRRIQPADYSEALYEVQTAAFSAYPEKYRPTVDHTAFLTETRAWTDIVYGAFDRETDQLCGYIRMLPRGRSLNAQVLKVMPEREKRNINAALIYGMLEDNRLALENGMYLCAGARVVNHETNIQEYLEMNFGFRKAYCRLHIAYAPKIGVIVRMLYPFRRLLKRLDGVGLAHKVNAILKMEEIVRSQRNEDNRA